MLVSRTEAQVSDAIWQAIADSDGLDLRAFVSFSLKTAVSEHARVLRLLQILTETPTGRSPFQAPSDRFSRRQSILRSVLDNRVDQLRPDFDREAGSFFIPRMVRSALNAAVVLRPDAFSNGELVRELTTILSYYLMGER